MLILKSLCSTSLISSLTAPIDTAKAWPSCGQCISWVLLGCHTPGAKKMWLDKIMNIMGTY
eukprot:10664209-Prorocentrum_lima.AAC.1